MPKGERYKYRSLFWPVILIGVGVIWLLANLDVLSSENLVVLVRLWPLLLVMIGLDLVLGHRSALAGAALGALAVAVAVVLMVVGPSLGWAEGSRLKTETFQTPIAGVDRATIALDLSSAQTSVSALAAEDSNLIVADLTHRGTIRFEVTGDSTKEVRLSQSDPGGFNFGDSQRWDIRLSPSVPLSLLVDRGSGSSDFQLEGLQLTSAEVSGGSGSGQITFPGAGSYRVEIDGGSGSTELSFGGGGTVTGEVDVGSGSTDVDIAGGGQLELHFRGGSGSLTIDVPDDAAVRVEVRDSGSGSVSIGGGLSQVQRGEDDEGVWQSATWDRAGNAKILLLIDDVGSGSVTIR